MLLGELKKNLISQRIIDILDTEKNDEINFKQFLQCISQFRPDEDKIIKLKFLFRIYDINNDGGISNAELFQVVYNVYIEL